MMGASELIHEYTGYIRLQQQLPLGPRFEDVYILCD